MCQTIKASSLNAKVRKTEHIKKASASCLKRRTISTSVGSKHINI